ncbi:hypothetical protein D3C72_1271130 [compost metagenome]
MAHVHVHRRRRLGRAHDGRAARAPHGQRHGVADLLRQLADQRRGDVHRVGLLQADQPQLQGQRAEQIVAADAVLLDEAQPAEAHHVRVGLGGRHVRFAGKVFERHRAAVVHQRAQQLPADLDALDAALGAVGVSRCHGRLAVWLFVHEEGIRHELISGLHSAHSLSANSFALNE